MRDDMHDALRPWIDHPRQQVALHGHGLARCFFPHYENNDFRKLTLLILLLVWSAATLGVQTTGEFGTVPYIALTAFVWTLVGKQWDVEVKGIAPQIQIRDTDDDD